MSVILHHQSPPHLQLHGSPRASQRLFLFVRSLLQSLHHYHDLRTASQPIVIHPFTILILVQPSTLPIHLFVMQYLILSSPLYSTHWSVLCSRTSFIIMQIEPWHHLVHISASMSLLQMSIPVVVIFSQFTADVSTGSSRVSYSLQQSTLLVPFVQGVMAAPFVTLGLVALQAGSCHLVLSWSKDRCSAQAFVILTHPPLSLHVRCGRVIQLDISYYTIFGVYDILCLSMLHTTPDIIHIGELDVQKKATFTKI